LKKTGDYQKVSMPGIAKPHQESQHSGQHAVVRQVAGAVRERAGRKRQAGAILERDQPSLARSPHASAPTSLLEELEALTTRTSKSNRLNSNGTHFQQDAGCLNPTKTKGSVHHWQASKTTPMEKENTGTIAME